MSDILELLPTFGEAMLTTLQISLLAAVLGMLGGFILHLMRMRAPHGFGWPYRAYIWLIRGTPYISQLFLVYFGLPVIGLRLSATQATVLSLGLYATAYFAEIFRAAWASLSRGQLEAAHAFGISHTKRFLHIECPQALAFALPLIANQIILTIKESAVASIVTVPELTMTTSNVVSSTYSYILPYALLIAAYWLLTQSIALIARGMRQFIPFLRKCP